MHSFTSKLKDELCISFSHVPTWFHLGEDVAGIGIYISVFPWNDLLTTVKVLYINALGTIWSQKLIYVMVDKCKVLDL
jgi:hypothetical protein